MHGNPGAASIARFAPTLVVGLIPFNTHIFLLLDHSLEFYIRLKIARRP